ncbi:MAG TPA: DUF29 domain-containing protein [Cyanobacteria bacterium UBA11162]|nr:DUF29 domain-containing protein [Cyanobacteria bacterium UBA12227]HAX88290.1 DUF29 domain-containing protein [Cyanobacteria bacterium UBA11370]HBL11526.1 DUF29 domain-containing protein [Cyanobacteria bacterium UBA11162]HBY81775.1 DUF29 domain-containing protein [Cyanobacteria bacterium UBA11148]
MTQTIQESLYESDFLLWTQDTVAKLKARDFDHLDLENLIEEVETLGRSEKQELESRLETLLAHLLKRIYVNMPDCFNGWENTIREQRRRIFLRLKNTPSLKAYWDQAFQDAWFLALGNVRDEYAEKGYHFPDAWQFESNIDAMLNINFWE